MRLRVRRNGRHPIYDAPDLPSDDSLDGSSEAPLPDAPAEADIPLETLPVEAAPPPVANAAPMRTSLARRLSFALRRRTTAIDLLEDEARVVVLRGREVVGWGTAALEDPSARGDPENDAPPDAQIRALLSALGPRRGRLIASIADSRTLLRRLRLRGVGRRYLPQVVASEVLETIPYSEEEVEIAWRRGKAGAELEVLAFAVPKHTLEGHVALLRRVRRRPAALYSRGASLAMVAGAPDALIVDVAPRSALVVLARDRAPEVVHQADLPPRSAGLERRARALARAVEQVAAYRAARNGSGDAAPLPIAVTGQVAGEPGLARLLEAISGREAVAFEPPFRWPDHFPALEYASNLGMALADRAGVIGRLARIRVPSLNLLPERLRPRSPFLLPAGLLASVLLFGYAALGLTARVDAAASTQATLTAEVDSLERQARMHRLEAAGAEASERRVASAAGETRMLEDHLAGLARGRAATLAQVDTPLGEALPEGVRLGSLTVQEGGVALSGVAQSFEQVFHYAAALGLAGPFDDVRIVRMESSGPLGSPAASPGSVAGTVWFQIDLSTLAEAPPEPTVVD